MIAKKNSKYSFEQVKTALFPLGMMGVSAMVLAAFTYRSPLDDYKRKIEIPQAKMEIHEVEKQEVEIPKIVTQQVSNPTNEVQQSQAPSDPSASTLPDEHSQTVTNQNVIPVVNITLPGIPKIPIGTVKPTDTPVEFPDVDAAYVGGSVQMQKDIANIQQYPQDAVDMGDQGTVYVKFIVERDGSITNISIERGVTPSLDREAKRIVRNLKTWEPGLVAAEPVRTVMRMPITFKLK